MSKTIKTKVVTGQATNKQFRTFRSCEARVVMAGKLEQF